MVYTQRRFDTEKLSSSVAHATYLCKSTKKKLKYTYYFKCVLT
jgi:hypothetical protein